MRFVPGAKVVHSTINLLIIGTIHLAFAMDNSQDPLLEHSIFGGFQCTTRRLAHSANTLGKMFPVRVHPMNDTRTDSLVWAWTYTRYSWVLLQLSVSMVVAFITIPTLRLLTPTWYHTAIIVMNAWVLWGHRRKPPIILIAFFILYTVTMSAFLTYGIIIGSRECIHLASSLQLMVIIRGESSPISDIIGTCLLPKPGSDLFFRTGAFSDNSVW